MPVCKCFCLILHWCVLVLRWRRALYCVYIYIYVCACVFICVCVCSCHVCMRMPGYLASLRLLKIHYKVTSAQPETNDGWMKGSAGARLGLVLACAGDTYIHIHTHMRTHSHTCTHFNPLAEHCRYTELSNKGLNSQRWVG